jgi:hypothetical protein
MRRSLLLVRENPTEKSASLGLIKISFSMGCAGKEAQ